MSQERFYNDPEDVEWLLSTHLKGRPGASLRGMKSFVLFGNEDAPDRIHAYAVKVPLITTPYYVVRFDERGRWLDTTGMVWPGGPKDKPHARGRGVGSANAERVALDKYEREYRAWAAKGLHGYGPAVQWPLSPNDNRLHAIREKIGAERREGRRNPPRRPDQHLVGYIDRPRPGQPMTDGKGRETNWVLSRVVQEYRDQFGDKSAAVILSHVRHKGRHAVGYLLIDGGSLFRGETTKESDWHDMEQEAKAEAESWAERDAEDRERDQWEQEEDD